MEPKVFVNGVEYALVVPDDFDFGEWADAEKIVGQGYDWDEGGYASTLATIYVSVRRVNDSVSIQDIRDLKAQDFEIVLPEAAIPPPNGAESSDTGKESKTSSTADSAPGSDDSPEQTPDPIGVPV